MTRVVIAFVLFFGVISCNNADKVPRNILSQGQMESLLQDIMKADQFLSDYVLYIDPSKKREVEGVKMYNQVFAIHQVEPDKFYKSLDYYQQHPALLKAIFDSISKRAEQLPPQKTPIITDSVIRTPKLSVGEDTTAFAQ